MHQFMGPFGEEVRLSEIMMKALIDFASCEDPYSCTVGSYEDGDSLEWPEYSFQPQGSRINLRIPIERFDIVDDSEWDEKCSFFEGVVEHRSVSAIIAPTDEEWNDKSNKWKIPKEGTLDRVFELLNLAIGQIL